MPAIALYIIKVIACSAIFMAYYLCFLRNGRFYQWNRVYLLATIVLSILIPLLNIPIHIEVLRQAPMLAAEQYNATTGLHIEQVTQKTTINFANIVLALYAFILLCIVIAELKALWRIKCLKQNVLFSKISNVRIYNTNAESAPFSFFNIIFWKNNIELTSADGQQILQHELAHIKAGHSYDKLFMQLICTVFWINPVFYLLKRELYLVHEYAADKADTGNSSEKLAALILRSLYPNYYLEFTSQFFQSSIKRRLAMLNQNKKIKFSLFRQIMVLPVIILALYAFALKIEAKPMPMPYCVPDPLPIPKPNPAPDTIKTINYGEKDVIPFALVDVKPKFQNGNANLFPKWAQEQVKYPKEAVDKKIHGTVYLKFVIDVDGDVKDIKVLRSVNPLLDNEAIRALKTSPKWTPGKDAKGKTVPVAYQFPVVFRLTSTAPAKANSVSADNTPVVVAKNTASSDASSGVVPFALVDVKPKFQNGEAHDFPKWAQEQVKYPKEAADKKIHGTVYLKFVIDVDGDVKDIKVLRSVNPLLDNEAIRALKTSPKWTPGKDAKGKIVPVAYQFPVVFRL